MSLHGSLRGTILSRGVAGGGGSVEAPLSPPTILSFTLDDMTLDTGVEGTFSWTKSGTQTSAVLDPGDGTTPYTLTTQSSYGHTYDDEGVYDATLTLTGPGGTSSPATINDIAVTAAPPAAWHDWGTFSSMTETRRNATGSTQASPPVKFRAQFHAGEVQPGTWFTLTRAGLAVPTDEWQAGEISTFPDGSMRCCVVRCYGPASWSAGATCVFELTGVPGAWPTLATTPTSDSVSVTKVTGASALKQQLEDIILIGSPALSTTQPAYGAPNLDSELNRAMARARTRKYAAGDICVCWRTWEKFQPPGGGTEDAQLWCLWFIEAWLDPATGNLLHLMAEPYVMNGWARVQGKSKAFKMKLVDGATTLRDFATAVTLSASDTESLNGADHFTGTNRSATFPYTTFDGRIGSAVKVSGSPPSGWTSGKVYQIAAPFGGADSTFPEPWRYPRMSLGTLGKFESGVSGTFQAKGTGGSTYTLTHYNYAVDKQVLAVRDGAGHAIWAVGGAEGKIYPCWTRAEIIRRMQTAQVPNANIELVTDRTGQSYGGLDYCPDGKNGSLIPGYTHLHRYTPGATLHHGALLEDAGYFQPGIGNRHKSECSLFLLDVLAYIESDEFMLVQSQAAAESCSFQAGLNVYENSTSGGVEIGYPICINNGPDKAGTQYSGMGPCRPTATTRNANIGIDNVGVEVAGGGSTTHDEGQMSHWSSTSMTGAHNSKEIAYYDALHCSPGYRELTACLWEKASLTDFVGPTPAAPHSYSNKIYHGETYYRIGLMASTADSAKRGFVGRSAWLGYALTAPDTEPYKAMLDDIAADNVNYMELIYDDPDVIGGTAKAIGAAAGLNGGGNQAWHYSRINWGALTLGKLSGIQCPNLVKFHSAFARWYWGDPIIGSPPAFHSTGYMGTSSTYVTQYFDQAAFSNNDTQFVLPAATHGFMTDAASSVTDGSRTTVGLLNGDLQYVRFLADGRNVQFAVPKQDIQDTANFIPANGDEMQFSYNFQTDGGFTFLPTMTAWFLYDKTLSIHCLTIPLTSGSYPSVGMTLTDSAGNVATIISGSNEIPYTRWTTTVPSPSPFVAGTLTGSNGCTFSYSGTPSGYGYSYKLSSTDPAGTLTPVTWTPGTLHSVNPDYCYVHFKTRRQGNQLGGLLKCRSNSGDPFVSQGWHGHIAGPAQVAMTMFGAESGCETTCENIRTFYDNVLTGQGFYFYDLGDSAGSWQFHYDYGPRAT